MTRAAKGRAWAPWLLRLLLAWLSAGALIGGWRIAAAMDSSPPWQDPPGRPSFATQPLTPPVVACVAVVALAVLAGRVWPRTAAAVALAASAAYLALGGWGPAVIPALAVTMVTLAMRLGVSRAWPWALALVPVLLASRWDEPALGLGDPATWATLPSVLLWTLLPALVAALVTGRRAAAARARADELRQVAADERLRVARDIHDVVGHALSMVSLQSGVALRVLETDPAQARASLEAIRGASKDALAELRRTLGVFRDGDAPLAPVPGLGGLPALVTAARTGGVRVEYEAADVAGVPTSVQAVAYRVVQEALTNAIRHAPGAAVRVGVLRAPGTLRVTVADDGGAPAAPIVEGAGLRGMRERVAAIGGSLTVTASERGVTVEAVLPWTEDAP